MFFVSPADVFSLFSRTMSSETSPAVFVGTIICVFSAPAAAFFLFAAASCRRSFRPFAPTTASYCPARTSSCFTPSAATNPRVHAMRAFRFCRARFALRMKYASMSITTRSGTMEYSVTFGDRDLQSASSEPTSVALFTLAAMTASWSGAGGGGAGGGAFGAFAGAGGGGGKTLSSSASASNSLPHSPKLSQNRRVGQSTQ